MEKKKLEVFRLIEKNCVRIEESSENGIIAHYLDVDGFLDDLFKNGEIRESKKDCFHDLECLLLHENGYCKNDCPNYLPRKQSLERT